MHIVEIDTERLSTDGKSAVVYVLLAANNVGVLVALASLPRTHCQTASNMCMTSHVSIGLYKIASCVALCSVCGRVCAWLGVNVDKERHKRKTAKKTTREKKKKQQVSCQPHFNPSFVSCGEAYNGARSSGMAYI